MSAARGIENGLGFGGAIGLPDVTDIEDSEHHAFGIAQRNFARAGRQLFGELFGHVERDRHRPEGAIGEAHVGADAFIILAVHETAQRRESAVHQQFQVAQLASRQIPRGPIFRMAFQFGGVIGRHLQLDEFAPVRGDKVAG